MLQVVVGELAIAVSVELFENDAKLLRSQVEAPVLKQVLEVVRVNVPLLAGAQGLECFVKCRPLLVELAKDLLGHLLQVSKVALFDFSLV